jgi:uncharacterized protein (DUF58 family)
MTTLFSTHDKKSRWFFRQEEAQSGPIVLKQRSIFILPTRAGFGLALALFIMLLGAINYNNSMSYILTFLLGSMAIVSILHTHRNLYGLQIETGKATPVFAGETAHFELWLENRGQQARYELVWQSHLPTTVKKSADLIVDIPANQRVNLMIPIPTYQRGPIQLGKLTLYTRFPLGLFHAWAYVHLKHDTLVYPSPRGDKTLPREQSADSFGEGSPHDGSGEDFLGYRNYQPGDSPRHIDWKAVAREQEWLIKQFGGMSAATVWLTWEEVSTFNDLETALSQLCLWILIAERQGAQYGLQIPGQTLEPDLGERHREQCLRALALFNH